MAENLSLVCKGIEESFNAKFSNSKRDTKTYVIKGKNFIKADEPGHGWACSWSQEEVDCASKRRNDVGVSRITLDRIQGTVKSTYTICGPDNPPCFIVSFEGTCKVAKNKKF